MKSRLHLQIWNKAICEKPTVKQYAPKVFASNIENNDPIIGFQRSFVYGKILVAGVLSAEMYALDSVEQQFVHKGNDFEKWYNKLARWIRQHYERDPKYGMCIGPRALLQMQSGAIQLAQHLMEGGRPI